MIFLQLFWSFFQIGLFSIGGGYAALPLIQAQVVDTYGWMTMTEFTDIITISQMTPGPIAINAATFVGIQVAGLPGALVAMLATVLPPFIILSIVSLFYAQFRDNWVVDLVMKGMQAGVAAVICDVVVSMGWNVFKLRRVLPVLMLVGAFVASCFFEWNVVLIILVCAVIGAVDTWRRERAEKKKGKGEAGK